jgi:protein-S-isoprenylcysteine O-methyltransferase Ste14
MNMDKPGVIILPPLLYGVAVVLALLLNWVWPLSILSSTATAIWSGVALLLLSGALAIWGKRTMQNAGTNINPLQPATSLVITGPFRFSRNPLYLSLTLLFAGLSLVANTLWGFIVLVLVLVVLHFGVILREERYLEAKFGESYRQYRSQVRRWL